MDKKELKEPDKLQLLFLSIRAFVEKHRMRIYTGAGIFILILCLPEAGIFTSSTTKQAPERSTRKSLKLHRKRDHPQGIPQPSRDIRISFLNIRGAAAAVTALYRLGNLYFSRHEIDAAILAYQDFLNKAPADSDLVTLAYNGLGACYEIKKDFNKALESYEKAMKTKTASSFEALNYSSIARVYEAMNNDAKAVEFYRKALGKTTDPLMTLYLKRKISNLG